MEGCEGDRDHTRMCENRKEERKGDGKRLVLTREVDAVTSSGRGDKGLRIALA